MKKLSRNEVIVINNEVRSKVNEIKLKDIKEKSKKDKDCINLIKLNKDKRLLNDKISSINNEMKKITESLHKKYNNKYTFCVNSYNNEVDDLIKRKLQDKGLTEVKEFTMPSSKDPNVTYKVKNDNGNWECDCPSYTYTGGKECKHIREAKLI
jgi:hypothetical protein